MTEEEKTTLSRRALLTGSAKASLDTAVALSFPAAVSATVFEKNVPGNRINVASIGCGRISTSHQMTGIARCPGARIVAVGNLDKQRADAGLQAVGDNYKKAAKENGGLA